jgi:hypothetical protein
MAEWTKFPEDMSDKDGFKDFIVECLEQNTRRHGDLLHSAYQNILANYGIQWIVYDNANRTFRPRAVKKWVPRPVTNRLNVCLRPLISSLASTEPILSYSPCSDKPEDIQASVVASRIMDIAKEETKVLHLRPGMARWLALTGNIWLNAGYDKDPKHGTIAIDLQQCVQCGKELSDDEIEGAGGCPDCMEAGRMGGTENPTGTPGFIPSMDGKGKPRQTKRPKGAIYSDVANIFQVEYDHEAANFYDSAYKIRVQTKPKRLMMEQFGLDDIGSSPTNLVSQRYLESLAFISPTSQQWVYGRYGTEEERTTVIEGWIEPCERFPDGLYGMVVGDQVPEKLKPFAYHDLADRPVCPLVHFGFESAPGRVAFRTPADDLLPLQRERNELQSTLILHSKRSANAVWFIPDSANVNKTSGEEGTVIRYSAMTGTPPPSRQPGLEAPRILVERMAMIDSEMEALAGSVDVLRGETPSGVTAYAAIEALEQKASQGLAELKINWAAGWGRWTELALGIFREYGIDERTSTFMGENGLWSMKKFTNADLRGALQIKSDPGLNRPTSSISRRAIYEQGARIGLTNPQDPVEKFKGWEILGMPEMMKDADLDQQHAAKENDAWVSIFTKSEKLQLPMVTAEVDNQMVHLTVHRRFCLSDIFATLPPPAKSIILSHLAQHKMVVAQEMMAQLNMGKPNQQAVGKVEGGMKDRAPNPSKTEGEMLTNQGGAASQPARANEMQ